MKTCYDLPAEEACPGKDAAGLAFALDEYSNNLTVDVPILHTPKELFLWL